MILRKGIEKAVKAVVEEIKKISKPIKGKDDIARVAAISADDDEIGQLIAEAMGKGRQGRCHHGRNQGIWHQPEDCRRYAV